jgi:hypothetical protein
VASYVCLSRIDSAEKKEDVPSMSKVQYIEAQLQQLSRDELQQVREWLDDILEDEQEFTPEFEAKIRQSEADMASGEPVRKRQTPRA